MKVCIAALAISLMQNLVYAEMQSLDVLKSKIEQFILNDLVSSVEGKLQVSAEKIDSRLQLHACKDDKIKVFNPYHSPTVHTNTMGIKCTEPENHWTLYVPVKISIFKAVYTAKQPLSKGQRITENDISMQEMNIQQLKQGYYTEKEQFLGQICKQPIREGMPFAPANIQMPRLVFRGQTINIVAGNDAFSVKMSGIALNDGILGDRVGVKNLSSKKILEGRVTASQEVRVLN